MDTELLDRRWQLTGWSCWFKSRWMNKSFRSLTILWWSWHSSGVLCWWLALLFFVLLVLAPGYFRVPESMITFAFSFEWLRKEVWIQCVSCLSRFKRFFFRAWKTWVQLNSVWTLSACTVLMASTVAFCVPSFWIAERTEVSTCRNDTLRYYVEVSSTMVVSDPVQEDSLREVVAMWKFQDPRLVVFVLWKVLISRTTGDYWCRLKKLYWFSLLLWLRLWRGTRLLWMHTDTDWRSCFGFPCVAPVRTFGETLPCADL